MHHAAGQEGARPVGAIPGHLEPHHVAVEPGGPLDVGHVEDDMPDLFGYAHCDSLQGPWILPYPTESRRRKGRCFWRRRERLPHQIAEVAHGRSPASSRDDEDEPNPTGRFRHPGLTYEPGMAVVEGDLVMVHGRYVGWGPKPMVAVDIFRVKDGRVVEHWDVLQEEVSGATLERA